MKRSENEAVPSYSSAVATKGKGGLTPEQNRLLAVALAELHRKLGTDARVGEAVGADQSTVSRVRRGEQGGSMVLAEGIARARGVEVYELLGLGSPAAPAESSPMPVRPTAGQIPHQNGPGNACNVS